MLNFQKENVMSGFEELDAVVSLAEQMKTDEGPIVLVNLFTVDEHEEEALVAAWAHDASFMKEQPGYISTQLHRGIAGSSTFMNYAVWQDVVSFRAAFANPEFQKRISVYPSSAVTRPHLFRKLAVDNHCTA
jgi:heme-degrading monooxygenase HmoA